MTKTNLLPTLLLLLSVFFTACQDSTSTSSSTTPKTEPIEETPVSTLNTLSETEKTEGWKLLFDGKTTDQWRGYNHDRFPDKGWGVKDECLVVYHSGTEESGFGGDIITRKSFEDFELKLEFLLADTANSGIFYLVKEEADRPIWHNAAEYQVLDNATYATMGITKEHFTAANYDLHPAETDYSRPMGEWNEARITKKGAHVEHWLNGNLVIAYDLWTPEWETLVAESKFKDYPDYGRTKVAPIGLQDHGHMVKYRNIKIRSL